MVDRVRRAGCTSVSDVMGEPVPARYNYFPFRRAPEPEVDAETLAEYAYEVMDLVPPTLDWNPRITARDGATLVNLPTWLWTEDADAVRTRTVVARAGSVRVEVTATTGGLSVTSPAGSVTCSPEAAATSYAAGRDQDRACTLAFNQSSFGYPSGFPVDASTNWTASWTSSTGESGTLAPQQVSRQTLIPVAQSQALVTGIG